jgi:hypothetical protein
MATAAGRCARFTVALGTGAAVLARLTGSSLAHGLFHTGHHLFKAGLVGQIRQGVAAGSSRLAKTGFAASLGTAGITAFGAAGGLFATGAWRFTLGKLAEVTIATLASRFVLAGDGLAATGRFGALAGTG